MNDLATEFASHLEADRQFLNQLADRLDMWATESRTGGWSTHQVQPNTETANECRRRSAQINLLIQRAALSAGRDGG